MSYIPEKVVEFIDEWAEEDYDVRVTYAEDSGVVIAVPKCLDNWIMYLQWYSNDEYSLVNINSKAFKDLYKIMGEIQE